MLLLSFDEAHNIESVAEEGVSFELTSNHFLDCETDIKIIRDKGRLFPEDCKSSARDLDYIEEVVTNFAKNCSSWRKKLSEEKCKRYS